MHISRDVIFHENQFPFAIASSPTESSAAPPAPFIPPLHIPAIAPTRPTHPSAASNITPSSISS
jgi:hypothetical protein